MSNSYSRGIRITGGKWRGKKLDVLKKSHLRPSSSRTRETVFNWLATHIYGAVCLDLFSGSGALAFESLSRGAHWVTMVDHDQDVIDDLLGKRRAMGESNSEVIKSDALSWLSTGRKKKYDIVFLDPPFDGGFIKSTLSSLSNDWLSPNALVYLEQRKGDINLDANWVIKKRSKTAKVDYALVVNDG